MALFKLTHDASLELHSKHVFLFLLELKEMEVFI